MEIETSDVKVRKEALLVALVKENINNPLHLFPKLFQLVSREGQRVGPNGDRLILVENGSSLIDIRAGKKFYGDNKPQNKLAIRFMGECNLENSNQDNFKRSLRRKMFEWNIKHPLAGGIKAFLTDTWEAVFDPSSVTFTDEEKFKYISREQVVLISKKGQIAGGGARYGWEYLGKEPISGQEMINKLIDEDSAKDPLSSWRIRDNHF